MTPCDCDHLWPSVIPIVTLWQSHVIVSHTPPCSCKSKEKEKEKKRNVNNDLAVLPSHDNLEVFFVSFLLLYYCFVILIKYSRAEKGQEYSFSHHLSLYCSRAERLFEWFEVFFLCLLYENSIKLLSKGYSSLNRLGHLLMLGANHLLHVFESRLPVVWSAEVELA